jgi:hypothetical protein
MTLLLNRLNVDIQVNPAKESLGQLELIVPV